MSRLRGHVGKGRGGKKKKEKRREETGSVGEAHAFRKRSFELEVFPPRKEEGERGKGGSLFQSNLRRRGRRPRHLGLRGKEGGKNGTSTISPLYGEKRKAKRHRYRLRALATRRKGKRLQLAIPVRRGGERKATYCTNHSKLTGRGRKKGGEGGGRNLEDVMLFYPATLLTFYSETFEGEKKEKGEGEKPHVLYTNRPSNSPGSRSSGGERGGEGSSLLLALIRGEIAPPSVLRRERGREKRKESDPVFSL